MSKDIQKQDNSENGDLAEEVEETSSQTFQSLSVRCSPFPPPEELIGYNKAVKNGAERIFRMVESQQEHRIKIENKVIDAEIIQSYIGQIFAFLIGIGALSAATYCIVIGQGWFGSILGIGGLTSLVTAFIKGRSQQNKSLEEKHPRRRN